MEPYAIELILLGVAYIGLFSITYYLAGTHA